MATAAVQVYRDVLAEPVSSRWRTRPKVAFVSPWPPSRTGVADYSERLVAELEDLVDVDLFVDGDLADRQEELPAARSLPANDRAIGGYDETVLTVGNSEFHAGALKALRVDRIDAVVQAHDARLSGLYFHGEARGAVPEGFRAALGRLYPDLRVEIEKSDDPRLVAEKHGALMAREVVALARDVLATSDEAAEMIRRDCAPADRDKVSVWQYAYPPPVERDEDGVDEGLVCSFGLVNPLKASDTVIEAFAYLASRHRNARLAFVGPISETLRDELGGRAESLGIDADVVFTGDISDDEYREWLRRAAAAIQLRTASNGETSGAVADCLAYGIPVVVTALGPQAGLPAFVPKVPAGCTPEKLAEVVDGLLRDPDGRQKFGAESREFVACRSFRHVAEWFVGRLDF